MSGIELIKEEIKMKEQNEEEQVLNPAVSFYEKCKAYLDSFDSNSSRYVYGIYRSKSRLRNNSRN